MGVINFEGPIGRKVVSLMGATVLIVGVAAAVPLIGASPVAASTPPVTPAGLLAATPGPTAPAVASPGTPDASCPVEDLCSTSFEGDAANVKTSNGVSWLLSVSGSSSQVTVELARQASTSPVAYEIHGWSFPVTSGGLKFSSSTGVGTIDPGSQTNPEATVNVTFQSTQKKVVAGACTSGSETEYTGTLTGTVTLVTGISGGGTVTSSAFTASSSHPVVTVYKDCVAPSKCLPSSKGFDDDPSPLANPSLSASGITGKFSGKSEDQVTLADQTTLAKPSGADRIDESLLEAAPATWTSSTKTLVVTTESSGLITGGVTIKGGKNSSVSIPCTKSGKSVDNVLTYYANGSWTSPAGEALTAHNQLGGNLVMPVSNAKATVFLTTVS